MQTEQFDDEFRKKLLDINLAADEEEVDRIYNHVSSKGNSASGISWTKVILYGLVASALIGSLTFNYIQNLTNKELFSSIDSLKTRPAFIDNEKPEKMTLRVDTVYVNKYIEKIIFHKINQKPLYAEETSSEPSKQFDINNESDDSIENLNVKKSDSTGVASNRSTDVSGKKYTQNDVNNSETDGIESADPLLRKNPSKNTISKKESFDKMSYALKNNLSQTTPTKNSASDFDENKLDNAGQIKESRTWLLSELSRIGQINSLSIGLKFPALKQPEKVIPAKEKPKYYSQSIKSVLSKMNYYVGASFDAGNSQLGGSLLGEIRITPKWSFQTGARWTQIIGDTYYTAEQFSQQTGQDFRALYAPYVAQNVDLLNIDQNYQLVQIPLMVAYHYEILTNWALRFGLGTDLAVYSQKHIHFDYKENNSSFDQGEYNTKLAVKPFNDLTVNVGLERRWNKFLFRVSPYITPQLRRTEYSKDDLSWGARVQVLYRIK